MSGRLDAELTVASLRMAATARGGTVAGVIFHSDRGSEYSAADYTAACARLGVTQSMGRVASALDNAAAEAVIIWSRPGGVFGVADGSRWGAWATRSLERVAHVPHLAQLVG